MNEMQKFENAIGMISSEEEMKTLADMFVHAVFGGPDLPLRILSGRDGSCLLTDVDGHHIVLDDLIEAIRFTARLGREGGYDHHFGAMQLLKAIYIDAHQAMGDPDRTDHAGAGVEIKLIESVVPEIREVELQTLY